MSPLSGQILAFSVSHNNERVKLYGYFAVIEGSKERFYRYPIKSFTLNFRNGQGRKRTSNFVQGIYQKVYPKHLTRIRDALAKIDSPQEQSMISSISLKDAEPQGIESGAPSSQETSTFKKPDAPASKKQKNEIVVLREQMAQQERQYTEQMAQQERQNKDQLNLLERQIAQQAELLKELLDRR